MPNPNAIVTTRIRFDPPLEGRDIREAVTAEGGLTVDVGGDRRIRLDPSNERSVGFATVLSQLAGMGVPAYLELDPGAGTIERLLIPTVGRVLSVRGAAGGGVEVTLDRSHARHFVRGDSPDRDALERDLRAALDAKQPILLVRDFDGRVIDVRDFTPDPEGPRPPLPEPGDEPIPFPWRPRRWWEWLVIWPLRKLWWWICYPWWWWHCPSGTTAQTIFNAMAATTCDPLTVPAPCIPFKYPYDGCWARASEMCRLMVAMGRDPAKVWIDGSLDAYSANAIGCHVYWGWHVAPTLCVRGRWPWITRRMVIDPSLFTTPVTEGQWKAAQSDPNATLTNTSRDVYWRNVHPTDPTYYWTNIDLAYYRLQLYNESIQSGPPPYCP
jgi:hypothetical protein